MPISTNTRCLLVEDDPTAQMMIGAYLDGMGVRHHAVASLAEALAAVDELTFDIAIVDYELEDGTALDLLDAGRDRLTEVPVVVLTAHGSVELAVEMMQHGAANFLTKPVSQDTFRTIVERVLRENRWRRRSRAAAIHSGARDPFVGESLLVRRLEAEATRYARTDLPIIIMGETGTGKGVLARWLHEASPRAEESFVDLNCAGLSEGMLQDELFGHERGAFTSAMARKQGLLELADRGTLFMDEMADMDLGVQSKVLKVLEDGRFRRVGAVKDQRVDIRIISACQEILTDRVESGRFREDLYYRINTLALSVPPLRERLEDLPALSDAILAEMAPGGARRTTLSGSALEVLASYTWPGNIRELRNVLERAVVLGGGGELGGDLLRRVLGSPASSTPGQRPAAPAEWRPVKLKDAEREHIARTLEHTDWQVADAASLLGLSRSALYARISKLGIDLRHRQVS